MFRLDLIAEDASADIGVIAMTASYLFPGPINSRLLSGPTNGAKNGCLARVCSSDDEDSEVCRSVVAHDISGASV